MKILYREQADKDGRHFIHEAVLARDALLFEHSINVPLLELEIEELDANRGLCQHLILRRSHHDAGGDPKYAVDGDGDIVEKEGWEVWDDPEDDTEPPVLDKAVWVKVSVAVDEAKARLGVLSEKLKTGSLSVAEKEEAFGLMLDKQAAGTADALAS